MDRQTDGRTDGWTNGRAKPLIVASPRLKKSTPIGVLRLDEQRNQSTKSGNTLRAAHVKKKPIPLLLLMLAHFCSFILVVRLQFNLWLIRNHDTEFP